MLGEGRLYYNVIGTPVNELRTEFKMRKDANGWFLKEDASAQVKMEAMRAFGAPKLQEYDLAAYTGYTQTKGDDNVVSPLGTMPKSQQKKKVK